MLPRLRCALWKKDCWAYWFGAPSSHLVYYMEGFYAKNKTTQREVGLVRWREIKNPDLTLKAFLFLLVNESKMKGQDISNMSIQG